MVYFNETFFCIETLGGFTSWIQIKLWWLSKHQKVCASKTRRTILNKNQKYIRVVWKTILRLCKTILWLIIHIIHLYISLPWPPIKFKAVTSSVGRQLTWHSICSSQLATSTICNWKLLISCKGTLYISPPI